MKKYLLSLVFALTILSAGGALTQSKAFAVEIFSNTCGGAESSTDVCQSVSEQQNAQNSNPIIHVIKAAIEVISFLAGAFAIIFIVISGLRFVTAGGDSNQVASARSGLIYALVGVAVVVLAQSIVIFVLDRVS